MKIPTQESNAILIEAGDKLVVTALTEICDKLVVTALAAICALT